MCNALKKPDGLKTVKAEKTIFTGGISRD